VTRTAKSSTTKSRSNSEAVAEAQAEHDYIVIAAVGCQGVPSGNGFRGQLLHCCLRESALSNVFPLPQAIMAAFAAEAIRSTSHGGGPPVNVACVVM